MDTSAGQAVVRARTNGVFRFISCSVVVAGFLIGLTLLCLEYFLVETPLGRIRTLVGLGIIAGMSGSWFRAEAAELHVWSILPYYEGPVPGADTYRYGEALARVWPELHRAVPELETLKLSPLPICRKTLAWHQPENALPIFRALFTKFEHEPEVAADLQRVILALEETGRQGLRFALVLKHGYTTCSMEWDDGGGTVLGAPRTSPQ